MNQQDVQLVERLRNNKIIEDNYKVCFLRAIDFSIALLTLIMVSVKFKNSIMNYYKVIQGEIL